MKLPIMPDNDADFTPDLARDIVAKYQEFIGFKNRTIATLTQQNLDQHEHARYLEEVAQRVLDCWSRASISNEPMIDALVNLRDALGAKCSGSTSVSKTDRAGSIPAASANDIRHAISSALELNGLTYDGVSKAAQAVLALMSPADKTPIENKGAGQ